MRLGFLLAFVTTVGVLLVVVSAQTRRFNRAVADEVNVLFSDADSSVGPKQLWSRWDRLPEPVRRYLSFAIREGTPRIHTARLEHGGYFRTKPDQRWFEIKGQQYFTAGKPGFVWNARVRPVPLLWIDARDRLLSGRGNMLVKVLSTFTLADASGPEIDQGSQLRWLAETAWFPYALVGDDVEWQPIDTLSARATLRNANLPASVVFEIDDDGKLARVRAERYRDIGGGKAVLTPWTGRYGDYREFNGFRVPTSVEVLWELESGPFSYVRFQITALEYNCPNHFEGTLRTWVSRHLPRIPALFL